jgi:hypothetical protein
MPEFKQVETRLVKTTYYVCAKDITEASSLIENGNDTVKTVDDTIDVQVEEECKEVA